MYKSNLLRLLLPLLLLVANGLQAQQPNEGKSLLWQISGEELPAPSYLFGTIHLTDERVFNFNDSVMSKIEEVDAFALEVALDTINPFSLMGQLMLPDNQTLEDIYTSDEYELIEKAVKDKLGMDMSFFNKMKPFFLMSMLSLDGEDGPSMGGFGTGGGKMAVDQYLNTRAKNMGKKLLGIEHIEEQLKLADAMPPKMLLETIKDTGKGADMTDKLIEAYMMADLSLLDSLMNSDTTNSSYMQKLLNDRNYTMADRIEQIMLKEPLFAAIGAGHLPGKDGVINLLRQKGYTVRPVVASKTGKYKKDDKPVGTYKYTDQAAGYTTYLPCMPKEKDARLKLKGAKVDITVASCYNDGALFSVSYGPSNTKLMGGPKDVIDAYGKSAKLEVREKTKESRTTWSFIAIEDRDKEFKGQLLFHEKSFFIILAPQGNEHTTYFLENFTPIN